MRPSWYRRTAAALVVAALTGLVLPAGAAPRDDLLALVPEDVGFCLVVNDLRGHAEKLSRTPWVKALKESAFVRSLAKSPEVKKLRALEQTLHKHLDIDLARLRDDVLGDAVVYAYRPGPPDQPQQDQGLVLLWARDAKLLSRVIDLVNQDAREPEALVHKEVKYFRRVDGGGKSTYYYRNDHLLAFSSREAMVREVIDRELLQQRSGKDKGATFLLDQLHRLGVDRAVVALWFNPRAFEAHIRQNVAAVKGPQGFAFRTFLAYWQALEGAALALSIDKDVEVKATVRAKTDKLSPAAQRFFNEASKPSDLWAYFPSGALVVVAGRVDFVALGQFVADFLPPEARAAFKTQMGRGLDAGLGLDFARDIAPYLGPDWGLCLMAPTDKKILVPLLTYALRVQKGPKEPAVDQRLVQGLNAFALAAVLLGNQANEVARFRLRTDMQDKVEVRYVDSKAFPAGFKPAYALKDGFLVLTSSPEGVRTFAKRKAALAAEGDVPLVRISLREWARFLRARSEPITDYLVKKDGHSRAQARGQLQGLLWGLELFEGLELTQRTGSGQVTWTLRLRPAD
jgi:hypothetical protein